MAADHSSGHIARARKAHDLELGEIDAPRRLRAIGISSEQKIDGVLADVPTWREQGVDAVFSNWRGVIGPKGMSAEQIAYWDDVFAKTVETPEWKEETQRSQLVSHYLKSRETVEFLSAENEKLTGIMGKLGLAK